MNFDSDSILSLLTNPDVITGAVIMLLVLVVVSVLLRGRSRGDGGREPTRQRQVSQKSFARTRNDEFQKSKGVSFLKPRQGDNLYLDGISESLMSDQGISSPDYVDSDEDVRVDAVTEAEVYMTYNRPEQAIQVLEEGYNRGDKQQARIALKLLDIYEIVYEQHGAEGHLAGFIKRLYEDRSGFSDEDWEDIAAKIHVVGDEAVGYEEPGKPANEPEPVEDGSVTPVYDEDGNLVFRQG